MTETIIIKMPDRTVSRAVEFDFDACKFRVRSATKAFGNWSMTHDKDALITMRDNLLKQGKN
jgi:hypothetical protein